MNAVTPIKTKGGLTVEESVLRRLISYGIQMSGMTKLELDDAVSVAVNATSSWKHAGLTVTPTRNRTLMTTVQAVATPSREEAEAMLKIFAEKSATGHRGGWFDKPVNLPVPLPGAKNTSFGTLFAQLVERVCASKAQEICGSAQVSR